jgi:hypothetical protein
MVSRACVLLFSALVAVGSIRLLGQAPNGTPQPVAPAQQPPIPIVIKKAIVFVETDCLHDFSKDSDAFDRDAFLRMPPKQQQQVLLNLDSLTIQLRIVKAGLKSRMNKNQRTSSDLSAQDAARLATPPSPTDTPQHDADEVAWLLKTLAEYNTFTDDEIASFNNNDFLLIPQDKTRGTGFLVGYLDVRLKQQPGDTSPKLFRYIVTNRHVIQPGVEHGKPCKVIGSTILLNHKPDATHTSRYAEANRTDHILRWITPSDPSVDLATASIGFDETLYDHLIVPTSLFVTDDEVTNHTVVEGDPVLFAGLFTQTFDQVHTLEPIIRVGSVALIPEGSLPTPLEGRQAHVYLTEAHAFGGNSGSPVFVDPTKFQGIISGPTYKLLGVISGEVTENSDLTLNVVSTLSGNVAANSGVSIVVPASELMKLFDDQTLRDDREKVILNLSQGPK